jgi:hypothetical protein
VPLQDEPLAVVAVDEAQTPFIVVDAPPVSTL